MNTHDNHSSTSNRCPICGHYLSTRGILAYRLKATGLSWRLVGAQLNCSGSGALNSARTWAYRRDLPWPITASAPTAEHRAITAYALSAQGLAWPEIARQLGWRNGSTARTSTRRHRGNYDRPWPPQAEDHT